MTHKTCPFCDAPLDLGAPVDTCAACAAPLVVCGQWRLGERLGRGGMSVIIEAHREPGGERAVAKILSLSQGIEWKAWELFERSAGVVQSLDHPALPRVFDFEEGEGGRLALVREAFDGDTLEGRIERHRHLDSDAFEALLRQLLELLVYLHELIPPVLHRDIKPSNIMFRSDQDWFPVLVDFDTVAAPGLQRSGMTMVGTPGYTAPEQFAGIVGPPSDLYGLGTTMLFVATHTSPDKMPRDSEGRFDVAPQLNSIPRRVRRALLKLVEPERSGRYQSAREVLADLDQVPRPRAAGGVAISRRTLLIGAIASASVAGVGVAGVALKPTEAPRAPRPTPMRPKPADPAPSPRPQHPLRKPTSRRSTEADERYRGENGRLWAPIEGSPIKGPAGAPVTIVEFSDFECPYCSRAAGTLSTLLAQSAYTGKVRLVFKHAPLAFHKNARGAHLASLAAQRQGAFWPYHDLLMKNRRAMGSEHLLGYAKELGLNLSRFQRDLKDEKLDALISRDQALAKALVIRGVPQFLINGRKLKGAQPLASFTKAVDRELAHVEKALAGISGSQLYRAAVWGPRAEAEPEQ